MVTAVELARQLGVDPKQLRGWLRGQARGGHPLLASHLHYERWEFSDLDAAELAAEFGGAGLVRDARPVVRQAPSTRRLRPMQNSIAGEPLGDLLAPALKVVFTGTSVGDTSARRGHYYSHASNKFWALLRATGLTEGQELRPEQDADVIGLGIGITDLVKRRAASSDGLLGDDDYDVPSYLAKITAFAPAAIAFNGREAAKRVAEHLGYATPEEGPAGFTVCETAAYRLPSSSGASPVPYGTKAAAWRDFGGWLRELMASRT